MLGGGTHNNAELGELLVKRLERGQERLLQRDALGSERLEDLAVQVQDCAWSV